MFHLIARRVILGLESRASASSRDYRAGPPSGTSREPTQPSPLPPSRSTATGCRGGRGPDPGRNRLGRPDLAVDDREPHPAARRVCRLAVSEHPPGGRVRRRRGMRTVPRRDCRGLPQPPDGPVACASRGGRGRTADRRRRRVAIRGQGGAIQRGAPRRTPLPQGEPARKRRQRIRGG